VESPYQNGAPSAPPKSLWTAVTRSIDSPPKLVGTKKVDVGIVGAGFMGLADRDQSVPGTSSHRC